MDIRARAGEAARALRAHTRRVLLGAMLALALVQVSLARPLGADPARRLARWWVRVAGRVSGVRFEARGHLHCPARSNAPRVLVANHSSPLDIAALLAVCPSARFVAAADLFCVPVLGAAMRALQTVPVDRRSRNGTHLVLPDGGRLDQGALVVFPEGGIAIPGNRLPFHRGAFALAIQQQAEVIPVAIHHSAQRLPPRARLAVVPGTTVVEFLPPLRTEGLTLDSRQWLCEQAERSILRALGPEDGGLGPEGSK